MNRTEKKCFIASAGVHLLLLLILLIGPAFLARETAPAEFTLITIEPDILTDRAVKPGGGNPPVPQQRQAAPPPATEPPQPKQPEAVLEQPKPKPSKPEPKEVRQEEQPDPNAFERSNKKPKKIEVSTTLVTRKPNAKPKTSTDNSSSNSDQRRRQLEEVNRTIGSVRNSLSSETAISVNSGFGGGGASYANYRDYIGSVYFNAWLPPERTARDRAVVRARVTIARDGTILSARITEGSGDPLTDASVQRTLDRVRQVRPLPAESSDQQRTYPLIFDLSAKRLEG